MPGGIAPEDRSIKIAFNVFGMMANAIVLSYFAYHDLQRMLGAGTLPLLIVTSLISSWPTRSRWRSSFR